MKSAKIRAALAVVPTVGALAVGSIVFTAGSASAGAPKVASAVPATRPHASLDPQWCIKVTPEQLRLSHDKGHGVPLLAFLSKTEGRPGSSFLVPCPWPAPQFPFRVTVGSRKISYPSNVVYVRVRMHSWSKERVAAELESCRAVWPISPRCLRHSGLIAQR